MRVEVQRMAEVPARSDAANLSATLASLAEDRQRWHAASGGRATWPFGGV